MLTVVNVTGSNNKKDRRLIRLFVNGISGNWTDNVGRSAPLGNYNLAIFHRQFERPLRMPPVLRFCYNLF